MPNSNDNERPTGRQGNGDRPEKEQDLHATEDSIRSDVDRLSALETARPPWIRPIRSWTACRTRP